MHKLSSIVSVTNNSSSVQNRHAIATVGQLFYSGHDQIMGGLCAMIDSETVGDEASWPHFRP